MIRFSVSLRWLSALGLLGTLASCAASGEGGVVGSGISSVVQGNVVDVRQAEADGAAAGSALPTLIVSLDEVPGLETTTDDAGSFVLTGDFAGAVIVRFQDAATTESLGTLTLEVAAGSTIVLRDVEIRADLDVPVQLPAPLQLNLAGELTAVDCEGGSLEIEDEAPERNRFSLRITAGTEVVASDDTELRCDDLRVGDRARVDEGVVNLRVSVIDAVKLQIAPADPSPQTLRVRRRGTVRHALCEGTPGLSFEDSELKDVVRVELAEDTELTCLTDGQPQRCQCTDLRFGDLIEVVGIRRLDGPGLIRAVSVRIRRNPDAFVIFTLTGDVDDINCALNGIVVHGRDPSGDPLLQEPLMGRLTDQTRYVCTGQRSCTCEEVRQGDRVQVEAKVTLGERRFPEVLAVTVLASRRVSLSGRIVAADCTLGEMEIETESGARVHVELTRSTIIERDNGDPASCRDLMRPSLVRLNGFLRDGGGERVVVAATVRVAPVVVLTVPRDTPGPTRTPFPFRTPVPRSR